MQVYNVIVTQAVFRDITGLPFGFACKVKTIVGGYAQILQVPTVCDRDVIKILAVDITFGKRQGKSTLLRVNFLYVMQITYNIKKTNI